MKEEMSRRQFKNSPNNLKSNMKTTEPSELTRGVHEHPNLKEIEKTDIMKVIESLKQEVKNSNG